MKRTSSLLLGLLGLPLLTMAQYTGPAVRLGTATPRPGQSVNVTYNPAGTKLAKAPAVEGIVYWLRGEKEPIAQVFKPTKSGAEYQATLTIPDSVKAFTVVFQQDELRDNNGEKAYAFLLYGADGKPVADSYASLGELYGNHYYYAGLEDRDADEGRRYLNKEFAAVPQSKRKYLQDYLFLFSSRKEEDRQALQTELDAFAKLPDLTEDELSRIAAGYQALNRKEQADAVTKQKEAKFGKPSEFYPAARKFAGQRKPLAQMKADYEKLQQDFPKNPKPYEKQIRAYAYRSYLQVLADSARWGEFNTLVKSNPAYQKETMGFYNDLAWNWAEKGQNLDLAALLSQQAVEWAKAQMSAERTANDPVWQTDQQLRSNRGETYSMYADTYGFILAQQGKSAQALPYLEEAAVTYGKRASADIDERYLQTLATVSPARLTQEAEAVVLAGKATPKTLELLKTAYGKSHNGEAGYEAYLAGLQKTAAETAKAKLREKMIHRPAPAFDLVDLDGKSVKLADLKGKTVVIDFWATWCGPCVASFPGMQKAVNKYKADPNVVFLFVNSWQQEADKKKNAADFITKKAYPFQVLLDEKDEVISSFKVSGIPTKFVVDKTGMIRFKSVGYEGSADAQVEHLSAMIDLANEPADLATTK